MTDSTSKTKEAGFLLVFGNFVINWNHAELAARNLLSFMGGGNIANVILSYQAGNVSLTDTIRLASDWFPAAKDHLVHFCNMMDTIRAYRNYYVHNLIGVVREVSTQDPVGMVMTLSVKGKFTIYEKALREHELEEIGDHCGHLREYGNSIARILKEFEDAKARLDLFDLLKKPVLPKSLTKTVRDPQAP